MTAGRIIDFGVARARLRGEGWSALEADLIEVPDDEVAPPAVSGLLAARKPDPRVCGECEIGGGEHAFDCARRTEWPAPVLTLAPPLVPPPVQLRLEDDQA